MDYYTVSNPSPNYYTTTVVAKTWYESSIIAIRTWLSLANQDAKTWAKLKELGLTTWKKLGAVRGTVTFYYMVPEPSTSFHSVLGPDTTYYEVSV